MHEFGFHRIAFEKGKQSRFLFSLIFNSSCILSFHFISWKTVKCEKVEDWASKIRRTAFSDNIKIVDPRMYSQIGEWRMSPKNEDKFIKEKDELIRN